MIKKMFIFCMITSFTLTGCTNNNTSSESNTINPNPSDSLADVTLNNIENKIPLGNSSSSNKVILSKDSIYPSKFINSGISIFFNNNILNNQLSSTSLKDNDKSTSILSKNIDVLSEYSIQSLTAIDNYIYFINISDGNSLYKFDVLKKSTEKILDGNFYEITSKKDFIFLINKNNHNNIIKFDTINNTLTTITLDKCGKYLVNDNYIIYQNVSDNCKLYSIELDGSNRTKLTDHAVDSFVTYNDSIIYVSGIDNSLYRLNLTTNTTDKILELYAKDLKINEDTIFYIDHNNSDRLTSIKLDYSFENLTPTLLTSDKINEYYPTDTGLFYIKSISPHKINFLQYKKQP